MRAVIQRVSSASVEAGGEKIAEIGKGFLILLGAGVDDEPADASYLVDKISGLRIFEDPDGKLNLSIRETGGAALVVAQFTLYGDARRGLRPSFAGAAPAEAASRLVSGFVTGLRAAGIGTKTGVFGANMKVMLVNEGPVTILLDSRKAF